MNQQSSTHHQLCRLEIRLFVNTKGDLGHWCYRHKHSYNYKLPYSGSFFSVKPVMSYIYLFSNSFSDLHKWVALMVAGREYFVLEMTYIPFMKKSLFIISETVCYTLF